VKLSLPAITAERLKLADPLVRVEVAVTVFGKSRIPDSEDRHGSTEFCPPGQLNATQDVYETVTSPVGMPVPLAAFTVTVTGVLITSGLLPTVILDTDPANGNPTPVVSTKTGVLIALLCTPT
jgi:hypothetical protein